MNTVGKKAHILIVDDDPGICRTMELIFKAKEYDATVAHTGNEVIELVKTTKVDLAILDIVLPDMKGIDLLSLLNEKYPEIDIIMITGHASTETAIQAINLGAIAYITKPIDMDDVLRTVSLALERRRMIDEKNRVEDALRRSETSYRRLAENLPAVVYRTFLQEGYRMDFLNDRLRDITGYNEDELESGETTFIDLMVHPDDKEDVLHIVNESISNNEPFEIRYRIILKDKTIKWMQEIGRPTYDEKGTPLHFDGVLFDITKRQIAEESLHREFEINRAVAFLSNSLNVPQISIDNVSSIVLEYSKQLTRSQEGYVSLLDSETKENVLQAQTIMFDNRQDESRSTVTFKADKKGRYPGLLGHSLNTQTAFFTNSPATHKSSKGAQKLHAKLNNFLSVPAMIANRVIGQISLANSERDFDINDIEAIMRLARLFALAVVRFRDQEKLRYHAELLDDVSDAVISTDLEFRVRSWNKAAEDIYGWSFEEVIGKPISEILQVELPNDSEAQMRKTLEDSGRWSGELLQLKKDGTVIPVLSSVSVVRDSNLNTVGEVAVNKDMTEQKEAKTQVQYERDRAMLYLDLMGHDIRNKLQAIVMGVDIFTEMVDNEEITPILDEVINAAEKIRSLISKVKKTEQLTGVPLSETSIVNVLNDTMKEFSLENENVEINISMGDNNPTIMADEFLHDLLYTFLENAVEHNPRKRKRLWVSLEMVSGGIMISIGDNGPGIPDDRKNELFDKTRRFGGVGLHQAKQVIDKYKGRIEVVNRVPKDIKSGTVIKIWIPKSNGLNGNRSENNVVDRNAAKISAK